MFQTIFFFIFSLSFTIYFLNFTLNRSGCLIFCSFMLLVVVCVCVHVSVCRRERLYIFIFWYLYECGLVWVCCVHARVNRFQLILSTDTAFHLSFVSWFLLIINNFNCQQLHNDLFYTESSVKKNGERKQII